MELFGAKFNISLGVWRLRFVLMLEDTDTPAAPRRHVAPPHHVTMTHERSSVR